MKTLAEWLEIFNGKTGNSFRLDGRYEFFYLPDKGVCQIMRTAKMVILGNVCGDGAYWKAFAEKKAAQWGLGVCGTMFCRLNVRAWARLLGYEITEETPLDNGAKRYKGKHRKSGKWCLASPAFTEEKKLVYYVTWEV